MSTILDRIKTSKLDHIAACKKARPLSSVEEAAEAAPAPRGFARALQNHLIELTPDHDTF